MLVMTRILIRDASVPVGGNEVVEASIIVSGDRIEAVTKNPPSDGYDEVIDASGLIAVPGGIDIHAHIYDPDYTHHEDWRTGTVAAAFGGVTTVFDMPLRMYVESLETLRKKVEVAERDAVVNYGVHAGMMNEENIERACDLRKAGVIGFKLFTCEPFRPRTDSGLSAVIRRVSELGALTMIHAEDDSIIQDLIRRFKDEGRDDPLAHHESRPGEAEAAAIDRVSAIARYWGAPIHIVHVASGPAADAVGRAKALGTMITAETCPQYLVFTRKDVERWGNLLKITPAIKGPEDRETLWRALAEGTIDAVASDHAPSPRDEKVGLSVWDAWGGIPTIENMFPLVFTMGFREGRITLQRYVEVTSENPAKIMGLWPRKGSLQPGADADIALIDPDHCFRISADKLHHKVDWTPYEGMEVCGWPKHVLVNGELVVRDRELVEGVRGRFVGAVREAR